MPATPACAVSPLSPATSAASGASRGHRHKPILAERFKTKMCRTFVETGSCPYEERCMFAHGDADLRSKEMNLADKLTTEEAIRSFQRSLRGDSSTEDQATEMSPTTTTPMVPTMLAPLPTAKDDIVPSVPPSPTSTAPPTPQMPVAKGLRFVAALCAPALDPAALEEVAPEYAMTPTKEAAKSPPYVAGEERASSPSSAGPASALRKQVSEFSDYVAPTPFAIPLPRSQSPAAGSTATSPSASPSKRGYRHDPYAPVVLSPQASAPGSRVASPQASPQTVALPFPEFFAPSPMPCLCVDCLVASGAVTPVVSPVSVMATYVPPRVSTMNPHATTYCPPPKSTYCAAAIDTRHDVLLA